MIEVKIPMDNLSDLSLSLKQAFNTTAIVNENEKKIKIDTEFCKGTIRCIALPECIYYLDFKLSLSENILLDFSSNATSPIYFAYSSKGKVIQNFENDSERLAIKNFHTTILQNRKSKKAIFTIKKGEQVKFTIISIGNPIVDCKSQLQLDLENLLNSFDVSNTFSYVTTCNLQIGEKIKQIDEITQKGFVRNLVMEGLVKMVLALQIEQLTLDISNVTTSNLTTREMVAIKELSQYIQNFPDKQHNIEFLSRKSGLSPNKLQQGFKMLHGRTVTDYIRDIRIQISEHLIKTTEMNISEIVYSIGFTSRSYFSKIFKEKYNCSPKTYKNKISSSLTA